MTLNDEWPELHSAIEATRTARDRSAKAGERAAVLGIPTLKVELDALAASYDRLLASLLYLERTTRDHRPQ
jgi:hypothetical protein